LILLYVLNFKQLIQMSSSSSSNSASSSRSKEPKLVDYVLKKPGVTKRTKDRIYGLLYKYTKTTQQPPSKSSKLFSIPETHTIEDNEAIEGYKAIEELAALEALDKREFIINVILIFICIFILICTTLYLYIYCTKQLAELAELTKLTKLLNYFR